MPVFLSIAVVLPVTHLVPVTQAGFSVSWLGWLASLASLGLAWLELARAGPGWPGPWLVWAGLAWFVRVWSPFDGSDLVQSGLVRLAGLLRSGLVWIGLAGTGQKNEKLHR